PVGPVVAPSKPLNLAASAGDATVALSWAVPSSNGGGAISGYKVYRGTSAGGESPTAVTTVAGTSFTDTGRTNGVSYFYVVTALNSAGESPVSNEANATPVAPVVAPSKPLNLAASA